MSGILRFCAAVAALSLPGAAGGSATDSYPTRSIRLIVPFPPGGSNDIVGRVIGQQLGERLGKPVVIDNRGGAGGLIGTETAIHAQPDGYTLLVISVAYSYSPAIYKLPYDSVKAIAPIASFSRSRFPRLTWSPCPTFAIANAPPLTAKRSL